MAYFGARYFGAKYFGPRYFGGGIAAAFTVVAESGAYVLIGADAASKLGRKTAALAGGYTLTGSAATLTEINRYAIAATASSYTLTGHDPALQRTHAYALSPALKGTYTYTGIDATLKHGWRAAAAAGAYMLTGAAAITARGRMTAALAGSYALAGTAVTMKFGRHTHAAAGSYTLAGSAAIPDYSGFVAIPIAGWRVVYAGDDRSRIPRIVHVESPRIART